MPEDRLTLDILRSSQPLEDRASNRSRSPQSEAFSRFMSSGWLPAGQQQAGAEDPEATEKSDGHEEYADYLPSRYQAISRHYPGTILVVPAGVYKTCTADEAYPFRPHSAFVWLTGKGGTFEPDSVVVLYPSAEDPSQHQGVVYFVPSPGRETSEFYADSRYGEFWVGARPSLKDIAVQTGLEVRHLHSFSDDLATALRSADGVRVLRGCDPQIDEQVCSLVGEDAWAAGQQDDEVYESLLATVRMWKDDWEIREISHAIADTKLCFENVLRSIPDCLSTPRGERTAEVAFGCTARLVGNGTAFDTIAAAGDHSTTLHYVDNNGPVHTGDLLLIDAGSQRESLYGADITRTFPVSGTFTPVQRTVYEAVLGACEAALQQARKTGCLYRDMHDAAIRYLAHKIEEWGFLPCSVDEAVSSESPFIRRWMPHGTGHHLGLDTHDCSVTPRDLYLTTPVEPGMVFTIEPGLYFRQDDELVPQEFRGIGIRIEDDIAVHPDGSVERLSEDIPRTPDAVEAWMRAIAEETSDLLS